MNWCFNLCHYMRSKEKVWADNLLQGLIAELKTYRASLQTLFNTDSVPIPLVYPQVVLVATRVYFLLCIFSRQYIVDVKDKNRDIIDEWVPFMTMMQVVFYMGWLKVAEALLNPLGLDDDDFECNFIIDRNVAISTLLAEKHAGEYPVQMHDSLHHFKFPLYSEKSVSSNIRKLIGSAALATYVEENLRVNMIPHYGYMPSPRVQKARGPSVLSTLTIPFRKVANSMISTEKQGIDNPACDFLDLEAGPIAQKSYNLNKDMVLVKVDECSSESSTSQQESIVNQ
uniref:Bestrophin homolog n=1 Tax=Acrobeloides nanus TaxID=290746 RepID=A0A914DUB5_9BILA